MCLKNLLFSAILFFFILLFVFFYFVGNQESPKMYIAEYEKDIGFMEASREFKDKVVKFKFENRGTGILRFIKVISGCPCVSSKFDKESLMPGETAELSVTVSAPSKYGYWEDKIYVNSNDSRNPEVVLTVKGFLRFDCVAIPNQIVIKNLPPGSEKEVTIRVLGPDNYKQFKVNSVSLASEDLHVVSIEKESPQEKSQRDTWEITLLIKSRKVDYWKEKIVVNTSSDKNPTLEIPVEVYELQEFDVEPRIICLRPNNKELSQVNIEITSNLNEGVPKISFVRNPDWVSTQIEQGNNNDNIIISMKLLDEKLVDSNLKNSKMVIGFQNGKFLEIPIMLLSNN